jgi:hypothetical protein
MQKMADVIPPLLLMALLSGCELPSVEAGPSHSGLTRRANEPSTGAFAAAEHAGCAAKPPAALGSELPLERGYYVATDTPCSKASNATVSLLQRGGIGGARDFCEFLKVEPTAPNTYRVTQACRAFQDSAPPEVSVVTYILSRDAGFTSTSDRGWKYSARHCPQSSMPVEWHHNDIREITY